MIKVTPAPINPAGLASYRDAQIRRAERVAQIASDAAGGDLFKSIRTEITASGLGNLGRALGRTSDLAKGRLHRRAGGHFSASGVVYAKGKSERTVGALDSYLGTGVNPIKPKRTLFLWIATDNIPKKVGRYRITPEIYAKSSLVRTIGPLIKVKSINGLPLLVAKNATRSATGGRAKSRTKTGKVKKGQRDGFVVAFYAIRHTERHRRVDPEDTAKQIIARGNDYVAVALKRT